LSGTKNVHKTFEASRWIEPDSLLAVVYRRAVHVSGEGWQESKVRLYTIRLGEEGFHDSRLIFESDSMVSCGRLIYQPEDSLLAFSYLRFESRNGGRVDCDYRENPDRQILAGKWGRESFTPAPEPVDTDGLLSTLSDWHSHNDGKIDMHGTSICFGEYPTSRCVRREDL
jgi:hypothetical protein